MALLLLAAGHETTSNLIANATLALGRHRDQLELLGRNPTLVPTAIEELLRWDSPVQVTGRVTLSSATLAGQHLTRGEQVGVVIGAANRDPALFPDPDRLDVARPAPAHLAFGHGAHYCVGAALARAEAAEVLRRLITAEWKLAASERPRAPFADSANSRLSSNRLRTIATASTTVTGRHNPIRNRRGPDDPAGRPAPEQVERRRGPHPPRPGRHLAVLAALAETVRAPAGATWNTSAAATAPIPARYWPNSPGSRMSPSGWQLAPRAVRRRGHRATLAEDT